MARGKYEDAKSLDYVELHVVDRCNLNCNACSHYSPLVKHDFDHFPSFEEDVTRLGQLFDHIEQIRLMGGEPFLEKNLDKYVALARTVFPDARIEVVTNGLLVPEASERVLESLAKHRADVYVSVYYPTLKVLGDIIVVLEQWDIRYTLTNPVTTFYKTLSPAGNNDPARSFEECVGDKRCTFVYLGNLYLCPRLALVKYFSEYTGIEIAPENYSIALSQANVEEILRFLTKPNDGCRYCSKAQYEAWSMCEDRDAIDIRCWVTCEDGEAVG